MDTTQACIDRMTFKEHVLLLLLLFHQGIQSKPSLIYEFVYEGPKEQIKRMIFK